MKKAVAALALSTALLATGCAGGTSSGWQPIPTAVQVSSVPATATSSAPSQGSQATTTPSSASDTLRDAVALGLKDQIRAGAGKTSKYLPAVRATVKKGTDDELIDYGVKICTSGSGDGINRVISEMNAKGYTIDNANVVAMSAGFFICPRN
jgi:hypothetical protein